MKAVSLSVILSNYTDGNYHILVYYAKIKKFLEKENSPFLFLTSGTLFMFPLQFQCV